MSARSAFDALFHALSPVFPGRSPRGSGARLAYWAVCASAALTACHAPPPVDVAPGEEIARVAALDAPLALRVVGPDGAALDEPAFPQDDQRLTRAAAVARAVRVDPGLQVALARVRAAAAHAAAARTLPNPLLDLVLRSGPDGTELEATFTQDVVSVLRREERASAADHRLRAAAAEAIVTALDVVAEVEELYVEAQAAAALLPLLEERRDLVERLVAVSRARLDAGEGTRSDVVTLDAQHVEWIVALDRARLDERATRLRLARLLGAPSADATWALEPWTRPSRPARSERDWIEAALASRPEIRARVDELRALDDEAAAGRWSTWDGAAAGAALRLDGDVALGPAVALPLPLFDTGAARRDATDAERLAARHELTRARRQVVEDVRVAYGQLAATSANLERVVETWLPLQRHRRDLAEDAYRAGQTDVTPLYLAEQELRLAETQAIEIEAQAARALVRLRRAAGGSGLAAATFAAARDARGSETRSEVAP